MIGTAARVRRALGCIAGAAIVGLPVELLCFQVWRMNIDVLLHEWPLIVIVIIVALPLLTGFGAAIGLEVAAAEPQAAGQISAWDRSIDLASLILLGILCSGLPMALASGQARDVVVVAAIALAFLAFGVAAARTLARWHLQYAKSTRVAAYCAILGLLYSLGITACVTLVFTITWQPCRPGAWCIDRPTWQSYLLTTGFFLGLPLGIWLALTLWLALLLGRWAAFQQSTPRPS